MRQNAFFLLSFIKLQKQDKQKEMVFKYQNCLFQLTSDCGRKNSIFGGWDLRFKTRL